jgi:hypothetical protein
MARVAGGIVRAILVAGLILAPLLLLPDQSEHVVQTMLVLALCAVAFTLWEYAATVPALVEFRGAPPFNRARFTVLLLALVFVALLCRDAHDPSTLSGLVRAIGLRFGDLLDFPLSPVRLVVWLLPPGTAPGAVAEIRAAAGLSTLAALLGVLGFGTAIAVRRWPGGKLPRNAQNGVVGGEFYRNLPAYDPAPAADLAARLRRDGSLNLTLGAALPYLAPPAGLLLGRLHGISLLQSDLLLVWTFSLWAFLPACLVLRGMALRRVARHLEAGRSRTGEDAAAEPDFLPV